MASQFFPGLGKITDSVLSFTDAFRTDVSGQTYTQAISDGRGSERIRIQFVSPIPAVDLRLRGRRAVEAVGARVVEVTFVRPKE